MLSRKEWVKVLPLNCCCCSCSTNCCGRNLVRKYYKALKEAIEEFKEGTGTLKMYQMKIELDENAQPESHKIRLVHHGIVNTEVDCLKKDSTFSKVT